MTTGRTRRNFTPEFKKDAVALITEQGYSIAKVAQVVDTSEKNLRRWKTERAQEASGERLNADEGAELARLRREVKELRMEKEILKNHSPGTPGLAWTETRVDTRLRRLSGQRPLAYW